MNIEELNIWQIIIAIGAFQGIFLAFVFFRSSRYQRTSNKFLSLLLLSTAAINIFTLFFDTGFHLTNPILNYLPLNLTILIPFALYYFVQYLLEPNHQFGQIGYLFLFPIVLYFLWRFNSLITYLIADPRPQGYSNELILTGKYFEAFACIQLIIVLAITVRRLHYFNQSLYEEYSNLESQSLDWLRNAFIFIGALTVLWFLNEINEAMHFTEIRSIMYPTLIGITAIVYWVGYTMYLRRDLFEVDIQDLKNTSENPVPEVQALSDKTEDHYRRMIHLMQDEHIYREPNLSMTMLAERTGLSKGYLSQILNTKEEKNFFEFVNSYRVKEVKRLLEDSAYAHYSVLGIGQEAGFKSKSTFNAVFKKFTDQTPSQYRKKYLSS